MPHIVLLLPYAISQTLDSDKKRLCLLMGSAVMEQREELPTWVPDSSSAECMICMRRFGWPARRHHCRFCGQLVCASCSRTRRVFRCKPAMGPLRCCDKCERRLASVDERELDGWSHRTDSVVTRRERLLEVICENQRWAGSWSGSNLLPLDPMRYTGLGDSYRTFPHDVAPPLGGQWVGDWKIDGTGDVDELGWSYAFDFPEFSFRGAYGLQTMHSYVRRRRWVREWIRAYDEAPISPGEERRAVQWQHTEWSFELDKRLLLQDNSTAVLATADPDDVKKQVIAIEDNVKDDREERPAALGRIYVRPLVLSLAEGADDERDVYVRCRCRSPKIAGPGWIATEWQRTRVVHQAAWPAKKLQGGGLCVAIANPRSVVDVQVCCADSDVPLASRTLSAFDIDASIEHDVCARAVDSAYPSLGDRLWNQRDDHHKDQTDGSQRRRQPFRQDPWLCDWPPRNARTGSPPPHPCSHRHYWPLFTHKSSGDGTHAGQILIDAIFELSYFDLVWSQRSPLPMAPENPNELSTSALRDLVDRTTNLVEPIVTLLKHAKLCVSWNREPRKTTAVLCAMLTLEYCLDAKRVLAVVPAALVLLLLFTLHRRCSGAWARAWIERRTEKQLIPCVCFAPKGTTQAGRTTTRRGHQYKQRRPADNRSEVDHNAGSTSHGLADSQDDAADGGDWQGTELSHDGPLEVLTIKIAVRAAQGIGDISHVQVDYAPCYGREDCDPCIGRSSRAPVAKLSIEKAVCRSSVSSSRLTSFAMGRASLDENAAADALLDKVNLLEDFDDLYNNPWLRRCRAMGIKGGAGKRLRLSRVNGEFEDDAIDERVNAAITEFVAPWRLDDGTELAECARYPIVAPVDGKGTTLARERFVFKVLASRSTGITKSSVASGSSHLTSLLYESPSTSTDVVVGEGSIPISKLLGTLKDQRRGGTQPVVELWLPIVATTADSIASNEADDNLASASLLVTMQVVMPTSSQRRKDATDADKAEQSMLARVAQRVSMAVDKIVADADEALGERKEEEAGGLVKARRGPIAEFQAARAQVLELQAQALRFVSYAESCMNLLCWVQPAKTFLVLCCAMIAAIVTFVIPLNFVLMTGTCLYFFDEYQRAMRSGRQSPIVDDRLNNLIRSVPDAADLVSYFAPRTRLWLDTLSATSTRVQLQKQIAPFAGMCWKTTGIISKKWQRRYIVIDDDRRISWWARAEDAHFAPKGLRFLASPATQAKLADPATLKHAPRGYVSSDLVRTIDIPAQLTLLLGTGNTICCI